jgi:hypothetical protein
MSDEITIERIERAIHIVATMMVKHDMPLGPTIRRLEAERDKLRAQTSDMDYAKEILARNGRNKGSNTVDLKSV